MKTNLGMIPVQAINQMAQGILTIVNGHFFKGLGAVIGGFFRSGKKRKAANAIH